MTILFIKIIILAAVRLLSIKTTILFSGILIMTLACQTKRKPEIFYHDSEPDGTWSNTSTLKQAEQAHSGNFVCVLDSTHEYSLSFNKLIGELYNGVPKKISYSAWIKCGNMPDKASLVVSIEKDGKSVQWESVSMNSFVKANNQWYSVQIGFETKAEVSSDMILKAYIWNPGKASFMADDFRLEFY